MTLPSRHALMTILAGGLYLGPFLAGLSDQRAATVFVFAAPLGTWSVAYRLGPWPRRFADLASVVGLLRVALLVAVMVALAAAFFLAGMGLGFLIGPLALPVAVPVAVPLVALGLGLLVQSPRKAAAMDAFLDDALRQLEAMASSASALGGDRQSAEAERLLARIAELPAHAGAAEVMAVLEGADDLDAALLSRVSRMDRPSPRPVVLAAVLLATDRERGAALAGRAEAAWVFDIACDDPDLAAVFAARALALLTEAPELCRDMPYAHDVDRAADAATDPETARRLADLRDRLNALTAADEDCGEAT